MGGGTSPTVLPGRKEQHLINEQSTRGLKWMQHEPGELTERRTEPEGGVLGADWSSLLFPECLRWPRTAKEKDKTPCLPGAEKDQRTTCEG